MKKRKLKKGPIITIFVFVFIVLLYSMYDIYSSLKGKNVSQVKTVEEILSYGYKIDETDSKYVKKEFKELKKVLESDSLDEKKYAELLGKIFLADFYSLDTAVNKNDIGGVQFVLGASQERFANKAKDTIYRYVENNMYHDRKQDLPLVKEVTLVNSEQKLYKKAKINDEKAYYLDYEISYEKDMGYPTKETVVLMHYKGKLSVVLMTE